MRTELERSLATRRAGAGSDDADRPGRTRTVLQEGYANALQLVHGTAAGTRNVVSEGAEIELASLAIRAGHDAETVLADAQYRLAEALPP